VVARVTDESGVVGVAGPQGSATPTTKPKNRSTSPVLRIVALRLGRSIPLLLVVSSLTFSLVALTPGDAAQAILGADATPETVARLREQLGLDLPLYEQYLRWLGSAIHGDLGTSLYSGEHVAHALYVRLPVTLALMLGALIVSLLVGVALGAFSAIRGGVIGRIVDAVSLLGFAIPAFWLGAQLIAVFAIRLSWFPATGYVPLTESPRGWLLSLTLPVTALALAGVAAIAKQTREAMLDVLGSEYITMAWANGVSAISIYGRHALKNAGIRVVTILGLQAVALLGGTIFVENVFALPGLGSLASNATSQRDLPMIQGIVVFYTLMVVIVNLVIDLAYSLLNPKVSAQ
jgi:peptide/nickel transport system permease protein